MKPSGSNMLDQHFDMVNANVLDKYKEMDVVEVDDDLAIKTCKMYNYKYAVITPDDIVIPPKNVSISQD